MLSLLQSLQDQDTGFLNIVAELWGFELPAGPSRQVAEKLALMMLDGEALEEMLELIPEPAQAVLSILQLQQGRAPLADFVRRFGPWRVMGAGRRDREKPWRSDPSPIEFLWYRGLISRAFLDAPGGPQEFVVLADELLAALPPTPQPVQLPAALASPGHVERSRHSAAEDAATILAALRRFPCPSLTAAEEQLQQLAPFLLAPSSAPLLLRLLNESGLLMPATTQPDPGRVKEFLALDRRDMLTALQTSWQSSASWNDLASVPGLAAPKNVWPNDPLLSRQRILALVEMLPSGAWLGIESFISFVKEQDPSFQRPAGDFDSWYLRAAESGEFLNGFESWPAIEGALLRHLICGPLHWLGLVELGAAAADQPSSSFRRAPNTDGDHPDSTGAPAAATLRPDGQLEVPRQLPLELRYQLSRFTAWETRRSSSFIFRLTPSGLQAGANQGLRLEHLLQILQTACGTPPPRNLREALSAWFARGTQARLEQRLLLTLDDPDQLPRLRANRSTARYLREVLGPQTIVIHQRDAAALVEAAARIGLLIEPLNGGISDAVD